MDRAIPFEPEERCEECGAKGAFDFMGTSMCSACFTKFNQNDVEDNGDVPWPYRNSRMTKVVQKKSLKGKE